MADQLPLPYVSHPLLEVDGEKARPKPDKRKSVSVEKKPATVERSVDHPASVQKSA